jgi:N-methylhydantoinase A
VSVYRVGIDTGGTFTDLVRFDMRSGTLSALKVPSTPGVPLDAFVGAITSATDDVGEVDGLVHGTTVATNALIQRRGAKVGFLCTAGHEDIPYIQRVNRQFLYDLSWDKPRPLVRSRRHCIGVPERLSASGAVILPLTNEALHQVGDLVEAEHFEALAICLLFSYVNTDHEVRLRDYLRHRFPDLPISTSHEIAPIWREYERSSTVIADAFVKPLIQRYVASLQSGLADLGFSQPWSMMKSNGGLMDAGAAALQPIQLAMSGPAGGMVASRHIASLLDLDDIVTIDVGGTSADVGMVLSGKISYTTEYEIEWGIPAAIPLIDIKTVGAGGGSIASVNAGGFLQVGPQSAGAVPGPICYGRGGTDLTLTDANLFLGRLNPDYFLAGQLQLDSGLMASELDRMSSALAMTPTELCLAIVEIANENMANAIRMISIERGYDPRTFALLAFGGAGPLHAVSIARKLGIPRVVIPPFPGGFCALGLLMGDLRVDKIWTQAFRSDTVTPDEVVQRFEMVADAAAAELRDQGFDGDPTFEYAINMRYLGQNYEMEVLVPSIRGGRPASAAEQLDEAYEAFHAQHQALYDYHMDAEVIEMISFKVTAIGDIPQPELSTVKVVEGVGETASRMVNFAGGIVACPTIRRSYMPLNRTIPGPIIIEEDGSTTVVEPGTTVIRTDRDILILEVVS